MPSALNILNLLAFVANFAVVYFIDRLPGAKSNSELSEVYQTIVTPAGYAFAIWGIIFVFEAIWAAAQLFRYKEHPLVVNGIRYNFIFVCLAQVAWSVLFAYEQIVPSLVAMLTIWFFLVQSVRGLASVDSDTDGPFWLLRFPFLIHCGWITAASFVNISVVFVYFQASATLQLVVGIMSLLCLVALALYVGDYVIPTVLAWATLGIFNELGSPKTLIVSTFSSLAIATTRWMALGGCIVILLGMVYRITMKLCKSGGEQQDAEESVYLRHEEEEHRNGD